MMLAEAIDMQRCARLDQLREWEYELDCIMGGDKSDLTDELRRQAITLKARITKKRSELE